MSEDDLRESLRINLIVFEMSTKDVVITDEEIETYFNENRSSFDEPEQVMASHILVDTEEEAKEIKKLLEQGEDFAQLAVSRSTDSGSAQLGGDFGIFLTRQNGGGVRKRRVFAGNRRDKRSRTEQLRISHNKGHGQKACQGQQTWKMSEMR